MRKKVSLSKIHISSFITELPGKRQKRLMGGASDDNLCSITLADGCSDDANCSDANQCNDYSACCRPAEV